METPIADSTNIQHRAEDSSQLSSVIANQLLDKQALASSAERNFKEWDKDKNGSLTLPELTDIYSSSDFSDQDRATAGILSQNYSLFGGLCASGLPGDINKESYTNFGYRYLKSTFADDGVRDGISQKDLGVFSMLVAKEGVQKFVNDADVSEKRNLGLSGLSALLSGGVAAAVLVSSFITRRPLGMFDSIMAGVNGGLAFTNGANVVDSLSKSDLDLMEEQFNSRKAMLDTLEVPRL